MKKKAHLLSIAVLAGLALSSSAGANVTFLNGYAGTAQLSFLTNPADLTSIDQSLFANAINHPDNVGYDKMAQVWFEGIEALGLIFGSWIDQYDLGGQTGFAEDPDQDGLANGLEAWFGTHPGQFDAGLANLATDGTTATFTHPRRTRPGRRTSPASTSGRPTSLTGMPATAWTGRPAGRPCCSPSTPSAPRPPSRRPRVKPWQPSSSGRAWKSCLDQHQCPFGSFSAPEPGGGCGIGKKLQKITAKTPRTPKKVQ